MRLEVASEPSFAQLVERLERDDRAAVGLLIERYGGALRRSIERALLVRRLLVPGRDRVGAEASDIFQSVMLLFLARLQRQRDGSSGTLQFETPAHLVAYLKTIAEHEMARQRSSFAASGRGVSGLESPVAIEPASNEPTPGEELIARELLELDQAALDDVARRLSLEERAIWNLVLQELSWPEIARRLAGTSSPDAARKMFTRAVRRIADELKAGKLAHDQADRAR
jgi:DNA-directed RNA polymerase specialized sigma24 family protein